MGFISAALLVMVVRGPWESGWVGWSGGWSLKKKNKDSADGKTSEIGNLVRHEKKADEEEGVVEKVLEEVAAEDGNQRPLGGSKGSSKEDVVTKVKS